MMNRDDVERWDGKMLKMNEVRRRGKGAQMSTRREGGGQKSGIMGTYTANMKRRGEGEGCKDE